MRNFQVTWYDGTNSNIRYFRYMFEALDYARLLKNMAVWHVKISKVKNQC